MSETGVTRAALDVVVAGCYAESGGATRKRRYLLTAAGDNVSGRCTDMAKFLGVRWTIEGGGG